MPEKTTAEYQQDIDYLFHVDNELPMEWYTKLEPLKREIALIIAMHVKRAVEQTKRELKYTIAKDLREHIGKVIMRHGDVG